MNRLGRKKQTAQLDTWLFHRKVVDRAWMQMLAQALEHLDGSRLLRKDTSVLLITPLYRIKAQSFRLAPSLVGNSLHTTLHTSRSCPPQRQRPNRIPRYT